MENNKLTSDIEITPAYLASAFAKFEEASVRLESRYAVLRGESEKLRADLEKKEAEVRKHEKMAVLGQTAAALAHEIRNPLGAIKLFMSLLREDVSAMPNTVKLVDEVDKSIATLDRVISNVLQFAKDKECNLSPVNLNHVISEEVSLFTKMGRDGEIEVSLSLAETAFIMGNDGLLRQLLINLLTNSAQALNYKGRIAIRTERIADENGDSLALLISDSGPGISSEVMPKLFEPFVTGRAEGTGLGLAVVKNIVERHGATISVQNTPGAEFKILFPISRRSI